MGHRTETLVPEGVMTDHNFALLPEERVMFERPHVVVTDRRLLATNGISKSNTQVEISLREVGAPKKYNGGQKNRLALGARLFGSGATVLVLEILAVSTVGINQYIEAAMFVGGMLAAIVGLYFMLASLVQVRPNTTVVFPVAEGDQIVVPFPEWDSPEADELTRQFRRAKRSL